MNFFARILVAAGSVAAFAACSRSNPTPVPNGQPQSGTDVGVTRPSDTMAAPSSAEAVGYPADSASGSSSGVATGAARTESAPGDSSTTAPAADQSTATSVGRPSDHPTARAKAKHKGRSRRDRVGASAHDDAAPSTEVAMDEESYEETESGASSATEMASAPGASVRIDSDEPSTMIPPHVGVTGLTGQERSFASTGHRGELNPADLVARERATRLSPLRSEDLARYGYDSKGSFKNAMRLRLQAMDGKIQEAETRAKNASEPQRSRLAELSTQLERGQNFAREKLSQADAVSKERWSGYKIEFRDAVADVERSFRRLETAMAR